MDAPSRPRSTAGIDGVSVVVSAPADGVLRTHLRADEVAAARSAALAVTRPAVAQLATVDAPAEAMEVSAAPPAEPGLLEGIVGAVLGFLFG
jgi:hypothetical protein